MMIIESVRSVAVPEEGKPYRKIKVSSDARTKLAPEVIRDAVSTYIREKVNHIVRGDCVVEVHWNGLDLRTLHLRSIQPLSPEEAARQRSETAARANLGPAPRVADSAATTKVVRKVALPAPLRTGQTASYLLVPSASAQTTSCQALSAASPTSSDVKPDCAQKRLRVVTINRIQGGKSIVSHPSGTSSTPSCSAPQTVPTPISPAQNMQTVRWTTQVRQVLSSGPQVKQTPTTSTTSAPSLITVTGLSNRSEGMPTRVVAPIDSRIVSASSPSMIARNGVRLIVASSSASCPPAHSVQSVTKPLTGPSIRGPVIPGLRAPVPGFIPPPGSRIVRMRANGLNGLPTLCRAVTPSGVIRPSTAWSAQTARQEEEVVLQPRIASTQVPTSQFSAPQTAQSLATIAPVMTVRQIAASNSNLSVRVNGNVIRAVPGQVIRRVTGEIVRVLDNGSLEPVDLQAPPKTIVTSREQPISLDSESDGSFAGRPSSSDSEFEVIKGDISPTGESAHSSKVTCGDILQKIELHNDMSSDFQQSLGEQTSYTHSDVDTELYDPELLAPAIDFSEGAPFTEAKIEQLNNQSPNPHPVRMVSILPSLMDATTVDKDGEMTLDPDLFENYINRLAIRFGYFKPPKPADNISYLFLRKPKPKSQCSYIIVPKNKHLGSVNIARNSQPAYSETSSSDTEEEVEPLNKKTKRQRRRRTSEELLLDAYRSGKQDEDSDSGADTPPVPLRTRKAHAVPMASPLSTETVVPVSSNDLSEPKVTSEWSHPLKDVKVSEPVECFESFVVMDRLRASRNKHTVFLDGLLRTRKGLQLFEACEDDMFFNLKQCRVNRKAKLKFDSLPNPLRPLDDPLRGELVAMMARHGIPRKPTRWRNVQYPLDTPPPLNSRNHSSLNQAGPSSSRSDTIDLNPNLIKLEPIDSF